jgi:glycosyltransferase involved in cell wall biosynthesis
MPLTALIPAGNEERHIAEAIASVRFADEVIVVVDAAATDRTREIAEGLADRVLVHEYENSAAQKNWAIPQCAHPWVFVLDADERVTPELRDEICRVVAADGPEDGYRIFRANHFAGQRIVGCGWQRDDVLRLFRRDRCRYQDRHVHADIESADGKPLRVGRLRGKLLHFTFDSFEQYLKKHGRYAAWASADRAKSTGRVHLGHLVLRPAWRFFRQYILYSGWRDGIAGFVICWMAAHSVFMKYALLWEKQRGEAKHPASPE